MGTARKESEIVKNTQIQAEKFANPASQHLV